MDHVLIRRYLTLVLITTRIIDLATIDNLLYENDSIATKHRSGMTLCSSLRSTVINGSAAVVTTLTM